MNNLSTTRTRRLPLAERAFIAAIIGAICTDAFISISHQTSPVKLWQFIASAGFGSVAYTSENYAGLGLIFHLATALIWAYLYAYVWSAISSLRNWVPGAVVLGVVIDVCMDLFMAIRGVLEPQTANAVIFGLITNVIFFALPVALYLSLGERHEARH